MSVSLRPRSRGRLLGAFALGALVTIGSACAPPTSGGGSTTPVVIYDSNPQAPLPPNVPSVGYEATSTAEMGDHITFSRVARDLKSVTVTMSTWAPKSEWPGVGDATGWDHPITLNLRAVGPNDGSGNPTAGAVLLTKTQLVHVPWRAEPDTVNCNDGWWFDAATSDCYGGQLFQITFDIDSQNLVAPDSLIWTIAYNTADYGAAPLGVAGPYNSLNVGTSAGAVEGTDVAADAAFASSTWGGFYCDNGAAGTGTLRYDGGCWAGYTPAAKFLANP